MNLKKNRLVPWVFIIMATTVFLSLSAWQFKRLGWKENQLAQIETALNQPAVTSLTGDVAYRKAKLTGHFKPEAELLFVGTKSGGFNHYVPFIIKGSNAALLVNTGWVEQNGKADIKTGTTTVEGVLRPYRQKRLFSPENAVDKNVWFIEDAAAMNAKTGLTLTPYVLETAPIPPLRNDHLGYAITWLMLAVTGVVMFGVFIRKQ